MEVQASINSLEPIVSLAKRRGFIFPSSEIYGGLASCYDYGPLGTELKRNIKNAWWRSMVTTRDDIVGLDASIIMHPNVWKASGHVDGFNDPMVDCKASKARYRADHLHVISVRDAERRAFFAFIENDEKSRDQALSKLEKFYKSKSEKLELEYTQLTKLPLTEYANVVGPDVTEKGTLTEPRQFNLMFQTHLGPVQSEDSIVYLRPETAQGIFVNFNNVIDSTRVKIPFGIAQQGKSFRNEVTTRRFTFRTCEFEQMEMEFFCKPGTDMEWYQYWRQERLNWFLKLGINPTRLRLRDHAADELAHYSKACTDVEYFFPFGWSELEGIACRGCFDLTQHAEHSKKKLLWRDQETNESYVPHVVEPALGTDRALLTFLIDAYTEEQVEGNTRTVLKFHPRIAPIKVAVFPLLRKDGHPEKAEEIYKMLRESYAADYDDSGNIGRRYRRQDEAGTPVCITVDHQTLEDNTVTLRDRDTLAQRRVAVAALPSELFTLFGF